MSTVWFDVEDIFHFAAQHARPTGIQRLTFEIYRAVQHGFAGARAIKFVRHAPHDDAFLVVAWADIEAIFGSITTDAPAAPTPSLPAPAPAPVPVVREQARSPMRAFLRRGINRLPGRVGSSGVLFAVMQMQAIAAAAAAAGAVAASPFHVVKWRIRAARMQAEAERPPAGPPPEVSDMRAGDTLVVLGSPWFHQTYGDVVARARSRTGMRVAVFLHDMIPMRHPEWCDDGTVRAFRNWYEPVLPLCDIVFTNSESTSRDLARFAARTGVSLRAVVRSVPIGTGFGVAAAPAPAATTKTTPPGNAALPPAGSYVLMVSTIEVRKNHIFLFRIWRKLLAERGPEGVPTLVFAGRIGWLVADFVQQLENSSYLDGKIRLVTDATDADLRQLYQGCLFTVFSSLYEGWGLPVTESLAFGKPCVVSNRTAIPEAGGELARYFDPEELDAATAVIRDILNDPADLAAWQARVARDFRPVPWQESAAAIIDGIESLGPHG